ncbi:MAG: spermidine synthase [Janthinobacterium lividum]
MTPWELLDTATIPGEGGEMRLMRRGHEFIIWLGPIALMGSRAGQSEEVLARLGCAGLETAPSPRVLIGGLGMGFTLRAALALLGPGAAVTVAELVPAVVAWGHGPLAAVHAGSLDDPRVTIHEGDVGRLIGQAANGSIASRYDAILLDVDNGPDGLTRQGNDALYDKRGLQTAWNALRPGGTLAVWSSEPDARFTARLERAGFAVEVATPRAHGKRGIRHVVWVATRRA